MLIRGNRVCLGYCNIFFYFFVTFAETRTVSISFDMSLHGTTRLPLDGFSWNFVLEICRKSVDKIQFWFKSGKNNECLDKDLRRSTFVISCWVLLRMRNVSDKSCRENQNTYFMLQISFPENTAVYEIMWKNTVQPDRPQIPIRYGT
jgi:hypothetical protein